MGGNTWAYALGVVPGLILDNQMEKQKRGAEGIRNEAKAAQDKLEADAAERKKKEEMDAANEGARYQASARRRALRSNYMRPTILTSPLGVIGDTPTGGKTLLGS